MTFWSTPAALTHGLVLIAKKRTSLPAPLKTLIKPLWADLCSFIYLLILHNYSNEYSVCRTVRVNFQETTPHWYCNFVSWPGYKTAVYRCCNKCCWLWESRWSLGNRTGRFNAKHARQLPQPVNTNRHRFTFRRGHHRKQVHWYLLRTCSGGGQLGMSLLHLSRTLKIHGITGRANIRRHRHNQNHQSCRLCPHHESRGFWTFLGNWPNHLLR